jgi:hypothetical protein
MLRNSDIRLLLAVAEGGSETVKAACWPNFFRNRLESSAPAPSMRMTSCEASVFSDCVKRGAGLLPNLAMWATAASVLMELGMSRRSLPYRCLDICEGC